MEVVDPANYFTFEVQNLYFVLESIAYFSCTADLTPRKPLDGATIWTIFLRLCIEEN